YVSHSRYTLFSYTTLFRSDVGIDPDKMIKFLKKYKDVSFSVKPRKKGNPIVTFDVTFDPKEIHENDFRKSFNEDVMKLLSDSFGDRKSTRLNSSHVSNSYA